MCLLFGGGFRRGDGFRRLRFRFFLLGYMGMRRWSFGFMRRSLLRRRFLLLMGRDDWFDGWVRLFFRRDDRFDGRVRLFFMWRDDRFDGRVRLFFRRDWEWERDLDRCDDCRDDW